MGELQTDEQGLPVQKQRMTFPVLWLKGSPTSDNKFRYSDKSNVIVAQVVCNYDLTEPEVVLQPNSVDPTGEYHIKFWQGDFLKWITQFRIYNFWLEGDMLQPFITEHDGMLEKVGARKVLNDAGIHVFDGIDREEPVDMSKFQNPDIGKVVFDNTTEFSQKFHKAMEERRLKEVQAEDDVTLPF